MKCVDCPNEVDYRFRMRRKPNKTVALLLALLLGLLPLQNLFAFDVAPMAHATAPSMDTDSMAGHAMDELAGSDCDECDAQSCCEQNSCTLHHCASCAVSAVIPRDVLALERSSDLTLPDLQQSLPANLHSSLFRPPRS